MPAVLALDLGTDTGWALRTSDGAITSGTASFRNDRWTGGGMRYLRFKHWLTELKNTAGGIDALYIEEVRRHLGVDAAHTYGGFLAIVQAWCEHHEIPYAAIPVGTWKRALVGRGNCNKADVLEAVRGRGYDPIDHNEADAIGVLLHVLDTAVEEVT
jgi:Holliday junction resolvasome RuvABC endonuclease subunit